MNERWTDPTPENVRQAFKRFADDINEPDAALFELFMQYPKNTDHRHVLLKVVTLNALYSTMIRMYSKITPTVYNVVQHIVQHGEEIDAGLGVGSTELVLKISKVDINGKPFYNYSFATKYLSFHRPKLFPIYDARVNEYLWQLRNREKHMTIPFAQFKREDLWDYAKFKNVLDEFREHYNLQEFSYKEVDAFLYLEGGKLLEQKERSAERASHS